MWAKKKCRQELILTTLLAEKKSGEQWVRPNKNGIFCSAQICAKTQLPFVSAKKMVSLISLIFLNLQQKYYVYTNKHIGLF